MHKRFGFTIVELLIVIVIIAILAAITVVAFNGVTVRSQATKIVTDLRSIEKAFLLYKQSEGIDTWPVDNDATYLTGTANPTITTLIAAQPGFAVYLKVAPKADKLGSSVLYAYDNDGDTYSGCSASLSGVNIYVANANNTQLMQAVDNMMDDGNLSCGRIRTASTSFHYSLATSS